MHKFNYWRRFEKALEHRNITTIGQLVDCIRRRASGDREVASTFWPIIKTLEPPGCWMSHCEYHTTFGFCGCGKNLEPSKCKKNRDYIKRQCDRIQCAYMTGREASEKTMKIILFPMITIAKAPGIRDGRMNAIGALVRDMQSGKINLQYAELSAENLDEFYISEDEKFLQFIAGFLEVGANYYIRPLCRIGLGIDYNDQRKAIAGPRRNKNNCTICLKTLEDFPMEEMQKLYSEYMTQRAGR